MADHASYRDTSWNLEPMGEALVRRIVADLLARVPAGRDYAAALLDGCGVRLRDILDHLVLSDAGVLAELRAEGWAEGADGILRHPRGRFPAVVPAGRGAQLWFRIESADVFVRNIAPSAPIDGEAFGPARRVEAFVAGDVTVGAIERNGHPGYDMPTVAPTRLRAARIHLNSFRARRRQFDTVEQGLEHTEALVDRALADLEPHWACDIWLRAEREYWMQRCSSGRYQKARQDRMGIGWSNIDHHTYDGSREHYRHTVRILEKLGYELREMLYAGALAGWGSQILEQPVLGSTIFADVDLAPEELDIDFAHQPLPPLDRHRRAGVLSVLHGESILEAGLNHVAALFDQRTLRSQLARDGIGMMAPFSDMPHLYQELTLGDWAAVDPARVDLLVAGGHIGSEEAEKIKLEGAIISHLENIERNEGYKGFNKPGIDGVLRKLDPRAYHGKEAPADVKAAAEPAAA